jgi:hypothetical protein
MKLFQRAEATAPLSRWLYLYPIIFGLAYSQGALFSSNQNTKFITGLALAGYGDIAADWMAGITDPFPLFSHLLAWQYQFLGLYAGTHLSFFLLAAAYGLLGVQLAKSLFSSNETKQRAQWLFCLLWLLVHTIGLRGVFQSIIPDGLAGQYMLGDYYQPCCFGVLLLAAIAAYQTKRLLAAAACLIAAPLFHPAYLISSAFVAAALVSIPANKALGIPWCRRLLFTLLVAAGIGACCLWNATALTSGDPAVRDAAYRLMAETRIPHHALPTHWHPLGTAVFFIAGFCAAWLGRRQLAGQLLFMLIGIVAAAVGWALVDFNPTVAVAAPWRVSVLLAPLSWVVLLAALAERLADKYYFSMPPAGALRKWLATACLCACLAGMLHLGLEYYRKAQREDYGLCRFLRQYHTAGSQYLIPPQETRIRLEAGVPVFATRKSHPTKDSEFLAWNVRIEAARQVYDGSPAALQKLMKDHAITHIVWPETKGNFPFPALGSRVYTDSNYSLWVLAK